MFGSLMSLIVQVFCVVNILLSTSKYFLQFFGGIS